MPSDPESTDWKVNPLKQRREALGLTLREVEEITKGNVSNAYLSQLENGKITNPSIGICCQLAAAYATPLDIIADWVGNAVLAHVKLCPACGQVLR